MIRQYKVRKAMYCVNLNCPRVTMIFSDPSWTYLHMRLQDLSSHLLYTVTIRITRLVNDSWYVDWGRNDSPRSRNICPRWKENVMEMKTNIRYWTRHEMKLNRGAAICDSRGPLDYNWIRAENKICYYSGPRRNHLLLCESLPGTRLINWRLRTYVTNI